MKLALLVLPPVMIPLISIGWYANKDLKQDTYRTALDQIQDGMQFVTYKVGELVSRARSNAELLANFPQLKQYAQAQDEKQRHSLSRSLMRTFHGFQRVYSEYHEIRVLLPDGVEDIRVFKSAEGQHLTEYDGAQMYENESAQVYYQDLIQKGEDLIIEIRRDPDNGESMLCVFRRLRDTSVNSQSATYGFLQLTISLEKLYRDLEKYKIGQNGSIFLVAKNGKIILDAHQQSTDTRLPMVIWKLVQSSEYFLRPRKYYFLNQTFLIQAKALDSQLYALVAFPAEELEKPILRPRIAIVLATLSVLILYINLVYGGLQRLIMRPLKDLHRATTEINNGNFHPVLKVASTDELGDIANTLNQIGVKLAKFSQDGTEVDNLDSQHRVSQAQCCSPGQE